MLGSFRDRLTDMVKANVYDLLELTELLPNQSELELDQSEQFARDELGRQIAARHTLSTQLPELRAALETTREKAEQAVESGQDDAARMAIAKQLDLDHELEAGRTEMSQLSQSIAALETLLAKLASVRRS